MLVAVQQHCDEGQGVRRIHVLKVRAGVVLHVLRIVAVSKGQHVSINLLCLIGNEERL